MTSSPAGNPGNLKGIALQLDQLCTGEIGGSGHLEHVLVEIGTEIGRVVGIDGDLDALAQEGDDFGALEVGGDDAVADGTTSQADVFGLEQVDQVRLGQDVGAVVEPVDLQLRQGLSDVSDGVGLVDVAVACKQIAFAAGALVHGGKFSRRVVALVAVQADADDAVLERQRLHQRRHRVLGRLIPQKTHDQARRDP